ncbi:DNA cytosine methyltransferase [Enterobacter cloacae subsp. cloacae]|uniref:DNA cytosine methyltransferase n=1 Tax=Enterobacter cloacae TaxID=550 RepID=UPI001C5B18A0|nr:DNA cytosine methyltransferase [Enterobacter cloacae]MBW4203935.1 DNA cytosine methyltransferase [Enterobacter cloacae subsp. cloacae]
MNSYPVAYYNEIDPFAAQWLRNLIDAGYIAPGVVDTRSIEEVTANDLKGFTQCHFFAGIGVWSYALRRAGWPDDRPVWTGSCPCQPFSACGKRQGKDDERHLFPTWFRLISECRPDVIFGEQVASKDGLGWLDDVRDHLERAEYAFAGFDLCAAGFGAPHIRQRLFWVADADSQFMETSIECGERGWIEFADGGGFIGVDYAECERRHTGRNRDYSGYVRQQSGAISEAGRLAYTNSNGRKGRLSGREGTQREVVNGSVRCSGTTCGLGDSYGSNENSFTGSVAGTNASTTRSGDTASAVNGFWRDADWLLCRDGKWRPVKPGLKPLVNGVAGRVGQLRAYGNAIVAPVAEAFIAAYLESAQ